MPSTNSTRPLQRPEPSQPPIALWCKRLTSHPVFQNAVLALILFNAVLIGVETNSALWKAHDGLFDTVNSVVKILFIIEIVLRLISYVPAVQRFFKDGWNVFDFVIVVFSSLPLGGELTNVARIARVLRLARIVSIWPELRLIVGTMLRSIPSMGHVIVLCGLLIYIYAVIGTFKFREVDPENWGNLGVACLTLFKVLTVEGWPEYQNQLIDDLPWVWVYFMSFIVMAVFVVVNLFIAVVTNNLQAVKSEQRIETEQSHAERDLLRSVRELQERLDRFEALLVEQRPGAAKEPG